jgi:transcriptional regulator with AAA-type ATPase domain/tetratricopeptide (TPR) repeat protein
VNVTSYAQRFTIQGRRAYDHWHQEKLDRVTIPNTPENLSRVQKIFAFHSNFMQNIVDFVPGNFEITILTEPFTPCRSDILARQTTAAVESMRRNFMAFQSAARDLDMDFLDFSKFQILPGSSLRFGWDLQARNIAATPTSIPIFKKNRHGPDADDRKACNLLKNTKTAQEDSGYLYRCEDFSINLLHAHSLAESKSNANLTIRVNTKSPWLRKIVHNNLFHHLHEAEILILKIDTENMRLRDFFSLLCGQKKHGKESPAKQVQDFSLFLKQSVFKKTILLIDHLVRKEDNLFLRFMLETGDISALTVILFNDGLPFDCDLELNEDPQNRLAQHSASPSPDWTPPQLSGNENELLKKMAWLEVPVPMAIARILAGRKGTAALNALLKKGWITEDNIRDELSLNHPGAMAAIPLQKGDELLAELAAGSDWAYAKISHFLTSGQMDSLEECLKRHILENPGQIAPGPATDLILRHLPQLPPCSKIPAYLAAILIQRNCLSLAERVLTDFADAKTPCTRLQSAHLAMRKKEYQKLGKLLAGLGRVPEEFKDEWLYLNFFYHEKISQGKKADEYEKKIKGLYYKNLCLIQLTDRSIYSGDFTKAQAQLDGALAFFKARHSCREEIEIQNQMAKLLREKGDFIKAESLYKTIYVKSTVENLILNSALVAVDLGNLYYENDDDFQAECWYQKALKLFEKEKNLDGIMLVNSNLANIFLSKGDWLEAERLLAAILARDQEKELPNSCAIDFLNWASLEFLRFHDDQALKLIERSQQIFEKIGNQKGLGECSFLRGNIAFAGARAPGGVQPARHRFSDDQKIVRTIFGRFESTPNRIGEAALFNMLGAIQSKKMKFETLRLLLIRHRNNEWLDLFKEIAWDLCRKEKNYFFFEYWHMYFELTPGAFPHDATLQSAFISMYDFFTLNKRILSNTLCQLRQQADEGDNRHTLFDDARLVDNFRQWRLPEDFFNSFLYEINKPSPIDWLVMDIHEDHLPLFQFSNSGLFKELGEEMLRHTRATPENQNYDLPKIKRIFSSQEKFFYPFANTKMIRWPISDHLLACLVIGFKNNGAHYQDFFEGHKEILKKFSILFQNFLQSEYRIHKKLNFIVGESEKIKELKTQIAQVSKVDFSLLITGESGSGKELVANAVHLLGPRAGRPFIPVNAAAIPETLLEAELFGYRKGAFSGAGENRVGLLEAADSGTIFLDEIADLPLALQAKILRALQEKEIRRLGENKTIKIDVRLISASNKNLEELIQKGLFRADLFYRLQDLVIHIPPLRERREDIPLLIEYFLEKFRYPRPDQVKLRAITALFRNDNFPGNVRELESKIKKMITFNPELEISTSNENKKFSLKNARHDFERNLLLNTLDENSWHKNNTAEKLGISRMALFNLLKKFNIKK